MSKPFFSLFDRNVPITIFAESTQSKTNILHLILHANIKVNIMIPGTTYLVTMHLVAYTIDLGLHLVKKLKKNHFCTIYYNLGMLLLKERTQNLTLFVLIIEGQTVPYSLEFGLNFQHFHCG